MVRSNSAQTIEKGSGTVRTKEARCSKNATRFKVSKPHMWYRPVYSMEAIEL